MIKLKKMVSVLMVISFLLFPSQVTFADTGYGDNINRAMRIYRNLDLYYHIIDSPTDDDWFYYTNDTRKSQIIMANMTSPVGKNYDLQTMWFIMDHHSGQMRSYSLDLTDRGVGGQESVSGKLDPGETVYFTVRSHDNDYDTIKPYRFTFIIR